MKTTILTFALALATMPLTFAAAQTPAVPAAPANTKPAAEAPAAKSKKHSKKAVKKTAKTPDASMTPAPAKQ